ncbi:MAG: RsmB/NOP family class I SAM-dependent RNA methyltransferase [Acutalibacteraceae bacterium]|nr:RsmB/NOP family class I SAM-dependent RNA methyltransferase [Acutalibacteraceae bacterium]
MNFFKNSLSKYYDSDTVTKIIEGSSVNRATTLRVNTLKTNTQKVKDQLKNLNINYEIADFSEDAIIITDNDADITETELFKNGEIYLQSLSSQLPPIILSPNENEDILDMCAAPGGKTTQIAALTNNRSHITACEMNRKRAERLKYNIEKQGVKNVNVMVTDARQLESYFSFDKILIDALCTGSGTFNLNNPKTYEGFTDILINKCTASQLKLLDKGLSLLKKGGTAVYSTCSVLPIENEEIVNKIINKHSCKIIPIENNSLNCLPTLPCSLNGAVCVCPNDRFEGFFVAKIIKE